MCLMSYLNIMEEEFASVDNENIEGTLETNMSVFQGNFCVVVQGYLPETLQ